MAKIDPIAWHQKQVLSALGFSTDGITYFEAIKCLEKLGIRTSPVRKGRGTICQVSLIKDGGAFNQYGEGETWQARTDPLDLTAIMDLVVDSDKEVAKRMSDIARRDGFVLDGAAVIQEVRDEAAGHMKAVQNRQALQKRLREERFQTNALLRAHGYRWRKLGSFGEDEPDRYVLYTPGDEPISVEAALQQIQSK